MSKLTAKIKNAARKTIRATKKVAKDPAVQGFAVAGLGFAALIGAAVYYDRRGENRIAHIE